ncbi:hypothetical protein IJT10_06840, partial [bacterium]|nr:hypothetical protein [bacterium]
MQRKRYADVIKHLLFLFCLILISGCSDDSTGSVSAGNSSSASVDYKDVIVVNRAITARTVSDKVSRLVCRCYDLYGNIVYGPVEKDRTNRVVFERVPVIAASVSISYLDGDDEVIGFYSQEIDLKRTSRTYEINEPEWEDVGFVSNVRSLEIESSSYSESDGSVLKVKVGESITLRAIAEFERDGQMYFQDVSSLCDWISEDSDIADIANDSRNIFIGKKVGETEITASWGDCSCSEPLKVISNGSGSSGYETGTETTSETS